MHIIENISKMKYETKNDINSIKPAASSDQKKYTFADLFRNPTVLRVTLSSGVVWTIAPITFYTIALESSKLGGDMYQAFALSNISDFIGYFLSAALSNRIGRKKTVFGGLFISGIFLIIMISRHC